jgi:amino acid transporter/nucleotide-binding universal stress UspA family protein
MKWFVFCDTFRRKELSFSAPPLSRGVPPCGVRIFLSGIPCGAEATVRHRLERYPQALVFQESRSRSLTSRKGTWNCARAMRDKALRCKKGLTRDARTMSVRAQHPVDLETLEIHRPRNLDWQRASALLYGDWGTSKAYVLGLAFVAAGYSSLPIILAVCALTALVGMNYVVVCRAFPEGGGVYSAAKAQGRLLAVVGALLLVADLTVTAALSGWAALSYLGVPEGWVMISTIVCILLMGVLNYFGPRHSGSFAVALALPTVLVVILIILASAPHLNFAHLEPLHEDVGHVWVSFVGVILALSGVEAIANLTGTLKPDSGSVFGRPKVGRSAFKAILPVAIEVSLGTALLGWAMLSLPKEFAPEMIQRKEDMLRFLAEQYGTLNFGIVFGQIFGFVVGVVFALLLLSAVNTAIAALIGLLFMMSREGDMPRSFARLSSHGVPVMPLAISVGLPVVVLILTDNFEALAGLYAIGVVGAICVNLGSCSFNPRIEMHWVERAMMVGTFLILIAVELTLAKTKHEALFFVTCVLVVGLFLWAYSQRVSGTRTLTVSKEFADIVKPEVVEEMSQMSSGTQKILVCVRGLTPVLRFAFDEAKMRDAALYVLYIREIAVLYTTSGAVRSVQWREDREASAILGTALQIGKHRGVTTVPLFATAPNAASIIVDMAATLGADFLMVGATHRGAMAKLLRGSVVSEVAASLPDNIQLVIYG